MNNTHSPGEDLIGRYTLESLLASHPDADIYRAQDAVIKRTVMLTVFQAGVFRTSKGMQRFLQSARAGTDLVHPHVAWAWEAGQEKDRAYLAERYVGNAFLDQLMTAGRLDWDQLVILARHLGQAVDFVHARKVVHGGISPRYILLSPQHGGVLAGFTRPDRPSLPLTEEQGQAAGEYFLQMAPYLAPEIWQGEPPGPAADQYALACVLAEALIGKPVFSAVTPAESRTRHFEPPAWPEWIPQPIRQVFGRALSLLPDDRYTAAGRLAGALAELKIDPEQWRQAEEEAERLAQEQAERRAARQEADETARLEAEDASRLAALEKARQEIEAELQQAEAEQERYGLEARAGWETEPDAALPSEEALAGTVVETAHPVEADKAEAAAPTIPSGAVPPTPLPEGEAEEESEPPITEAFAAAPPPPPPVTPAPGVSPWRRRPVWIGLILVALALVVIVFAVTGQGLPGLAPAATATFTPTSTWTDVPSPTATITTTSTETLTPSATATLTPIATATRTPTATLTLTDTLRPTRTLAPPFTSTPTRRPRSSLGLSPSNRP